MEINKVQWRMIAKGEKLPCDSFLMRNDGTITSMATSAGVTVGQDAYYLPVDELRTLPKEESEDEKVRKHLISLFEKFVTLGVANECETSEIKVDDILAWLEKQREQKPIISNNALREGITHFGITQYQIDNWLKKYVNVEKQCGQILANSAKTCKDEQKPVEEYNITGISSKNAQGKLGEMIMNLKSVNEVLEQKPAEWSEEDDKRFSVVIAEFAKCAGKSVSKDEWMRCNDWLYSLKDRVQPKQEWSEEDEYHKRQILRILKDNGCSQTLQERTEKWIEERLKSIRPQNTWNPSDEQIRELGIVATGKGWFSKEILSGLLEQLKKLKE